MSACARPPAHPTSTVSKWSATRTLTPLFVADPQTSVRRLRDAEYLGICKTFGMPVAPEVASIIPKKTIIGTDP